MNKKSRAVAWWLLVGVGMIVVQVVLGGITRLTGSGLSITKWNPIFGILPPLNRAAWEAAFEQYKQIGQFKYVNSYFTLEHFKGIYFWEWLHRVWARLLGVVFMIGFVYFLVFKYFTKQMVRPFLLLFAAGGLQGVIGFAMVKSGVNPEDIHVNYMWLAAHFIAAMILACFTLWFALQLLIPDSEKMQQPVVKHYTMGAIALLFVQLMYGAFMAGLKAASAAPTFPLINGSFAPPTLMNHGWLSDASLNALMLNVHFVHRSLAYLLVIVIPLGYFIAQKYALTPLARKVVLLPVALVVVQLLLGIVTVMSAIKIVPGVFGNFEVLALAHQFTAMLLLLSLVGKRYVVG
ncbi:MAG: heme A synthase [Chitinophagia bacterium]|nr:heme A synthase [Chitinophagia bacterium]